MLSLVFILYSLIEERVYEFLEGVSDTPAKHDATMDFYNATSKTNNLLNVDVVVCLTSKEASFVIAHTLTLIRNRNKRKLLW